MERLSERHEVSERKLCRILGVSRATVRRRGRKEERDRELREAVVRLSEKNPRYGYRKVWALLRGESFSVGKERVRLIRKREGLQVRKKQRKRRILGKTTEHVLRAEYPNHVWSYDFVFDATADGKTLKFLTVVDEFTREALTIHCSRHIGSTDVKRILQRLFVERGIPACIRSDNGPEFIARSVQEWLAKTGVSTDYIEPGSPWQNAYCESFNGVFRDGCLDRWLFLSPREARTVTEHWRNEYNNERPHGSLGQKTPSQYASGYAESVLAA